MSRDIYPSLSAAAASWRHQEVISNNIANSSTEGFKAQRFSFDNAKVSDGLLGNGYVKPGELVHDFTDGNLLRDDVDTHIALQGRGFFEVEGAEENFLVRSGSFRLDLDGYLVTPNGDSVLGQSGPIQIDIQEGRGLVVDESGAVLDEDMNEIDRIQILDADEVEIVGHGRWRALTPTREAENVQVIQGALEGSNANPLMAMNELIQNSRYFEAYQKAMHTSDEMDRRNINISSRT